VVEVDEVVAEAIDASATAADAKQVRLAVGGARGLRVAGDRRMLVTAVRNLVDNAVVYSGSGSAVNVAVRASHDQTTGDVVEVAVVDEGVGIPADLTERVFERFFRVDPARSRDTGGTGLGLSIVKHVAADHGGDVTVWSQPGRGSTFTIRLPRADLPGSGPAALGGDCGSSTDPGVTGASGADNPRADTPCTDTPEPTPTAPAHTGPAHP
jgi:two-component system sensor histidine kinase SenX3